MATSKIEQRNLQVFFVPKDNDFYELERFITKNKEMLKLYLLIVEDLNPRLKELLEKYEIDYIKPKNQHFTKKSIAEKNTINLIKMAGDSTKDSANVSGANLMNQSQNHANLMNQSTNLTNKSPNLIDSSVNLNQSVDSNASATKAQVFMDLIRSGKEITSEGDIIIFNRVNSGANIKSTKNIFVFGKCDGNIDCRGEYMVLSKIAKGKILFQGIAITPNMLKYKLNLITKDKIGPKITDILAL